MQIFSEILELSCITLECTKFAVELIRSLFLSSDCLNKLLLSILERSSQLFFCSPLNACLILIIISRFSAKSSSMLISNFLYLRGVFHFINLELLILLFNKFNIILKLFDFSIKLLHFTKKISFFSLPQIFFHFESPLRIVIITPKVFQLKLLGISQL